MSGVARAAGVALAAWLSLVACTPQVQPTSPPAKPGLADQATFILANPGGLTFLDESCRALGKVVDLPPQGYPAYPAMHPSRKSLAFGITLLAATKSGFGSDIYTVNLDGSGLKALVEHEADNVFYASPRFDPTGNVLYFHRRAAIVTPAGQYVGNEDSIERLDLRTGERKRILMDGADPDISADGRTLVYVHVTNGQLDPNGLWVANADGTQARKLFARDTFYYLQGPRFSPANDTIAFSGAGHQATVPRAPQAALIAPGARPIAALPGAGARPLAHLGVPSELFLTGVASPVLRSATQTGDDVTPAWSKDGSKIAYVGTGALNVLTVADGSVKVCAQGQDFFFGDLLWVR